MPIVYIWSPDMNHPYGHASLQTDKYHISFWPDGDVKEELGVENAITLGVPASLVFHQELDRFHEGKRLPTGRYEIVVATDEDINDIHEKFLEYNGIDPKEVTLKAAEKLIDKKKKPEVTVPLTKYSFRGSINREQICALDLIPSLEVSKKPHVELSHPFYYDKQSCVSFCFNIIQDVCKLKEQGTLIVDLVTLQSFDGFTVPWFESHIKKHWLKDKPDLVNKITDNAVTRSVRYWIKDRWTSESQTTGQQIEGFQRNPVDFSQDHKKK